MGPIVWLGCGTIAVWAVAISAVVAAASLPATRNISRYGKLLTPQQRVPGSSGAARSYWDRFEDMTVPKAWFLHYYVVGSVWHGLLLLAAGAALTVRRTHVGERGTPTPTDLFSTVGSATFFASLLFQLHLLRRLLECLFMSKASEARMHVLVYMGGLAFYIGAAWTLTGLPLLAPRILLILQLRSRDTIAQEQGQEHHHQQALVTGDGDGPPLLPRWLSLMLVLALHVASFVAFCSGSLHQTRCHCILADLRRRTCDDDLKTTSSSVGGSTRHRSSASYGLPRGDWFDLVSTPHYLAEILIYTGLVVMGAVDLDYTLAAVGGLAGAVLAAGRAMVWLWVVVNLSITARRTHAWYATTFPGGGEQSTRTALWPPGGLVAVAKMVVGDLMDLAAALAPAGWATERKRKGE